MDLAETDDGLPQSPKSSDTAVIQDARPRMEGVVKRLEMDNLAQRDENRALKATARSYEEEISSLQQKIKDMEAQALQDMPTTKVGREVRLRYLEQHRSRMGRSIGKVGHDRIRCGDRAAHRGRPVVDAILCLTASIRDHGAYIDLYGVTPAATKEMMDVPEMIEVTGFRASLQSEGKLTPVFQSLFERLLEVAASYTSPSKLRVAFKEDKVLQQCHHGLQDCYDRIVGVVPR
jgi:hypothetical protein